MRKFILSLICIEIELCAYAQKDVTQFLGIPVDGSKVEMVQKLKKKGFRSTSYDNDLLEGQFNGCDVYVNIVTNGDKVCRVMVSDVNRIDERAIQIRFNNLCRQFEKNPKYMSFGNVETIPDNEDISYQINVKKKRYEAVFYQQPVEATDTALMRETFLPIVLNKYTVEELANPTEEVTEGLMKLTFEFLYERALKKSVWFMISEIYGKYYITMFYDNEYNRADGGGH